MSTNLRLADDVDDAGGEHVTGPAEPGETGVRRLTLATIAGEALSASAFVRADHVRAQGIHRALVTGTRALVNV